MTAVRLKRPWITDTAQGGQDSGWLEARDHCLPLSDSLPLYVRLMSMSGRYSEDGSEAMRHTAYKIYEWERQDRTEIDLMKKVCNMIMSCYWNVCRAIFTGYTNALTSDRSSGLNRYAIKKTKCNMSREQGWQ